MSTKPASFNKSTTSSRVNAVLYYGTGLLIKVDQKGRKVEESTRFSNNLKLQTRHLYSNGCLERISIEFSKASLNLLQSELNDVRDFIVKNLGGC